MRPFINEDFLLQTDTARELYHDHAASMPIIDYHCHLPPDQIAGDRNFDNLTQIWLYGDHYKWRAMRACGVPEEYITGSASDEEKFDKWAETTPRILRNPLYHWTHLELQRYFGITDLLDPQSADYIYKEASYLLKTDDFSVQSLIRKMNVEVICTTDDPVDNLEYHRQIKKSDFQVIVLPAFRPDKAMDVSSPDSFKAYVEKIEQAADTSVNTLDDYLEALKSRHDFFHEMGCRLSDHGLKQVDAVEYSTGEADSAFNKLMDGKELNGEEASKFRSFLLLEFARMDHEKNWVQQYHLGALRNTNSRLLDKLGPDTGFDSIGDFPQAESLARFLDTLDSTDQLAKTILYNLNPADNEVFATMIGNYNDGSVKGKMQWGSAWWFNDQLDGMERQINTLSNIGLLSCFIGMLTDSRSFMSFPRHEYFRRLLCNIIGSDVEKGLLPGDLQILSKLVKDVCYYNARGYFDFWE